MNSCNSNGRRLVIGWIIAVAVAGMLAGCGPDTQYLALQRQVLEQKEQIQRLDKRIADQHETIRVLRAQLADETGVTPEELEQLFGLSELVIEGRSGGYDTDRKVGDEGVVLYVQPVDNYGDVVKAPGRIEVALYDLNDPSGEFLYHSCVFETAELMDKLWYGKMWTYHYTLKCPWPPSGPPARGRLTAKVVFTHHLTGQRLETQRVVNITLPADAEEAMPADGG